MEFYLVQRNTDPNQALETPIGRSGRQETVRRPFSLDALDEFELSHTTIEVENGLEDCRDTK